jgi:hypothetical protein
MQTKWGQPFEMQAFKSEWLADERSMPMEERSFGALA